MQDQNNLSNHKLSRQEYNKRYYEQNKTKILQKRKGPDVNNILNLFTESPEKESTSKTQFRKLLISCVRVFEVSAFLGLSAIMTYLLLKESAGFYLDSNESLISAYTKAGMIELTAILFSFSRSKNIFVRWGQRLIVILLCGLSLWTMSGRVVKNASQDTAKVQTSLQIIQELEAERSQKEALRQEFLNRGWLRRTRSYEIGLEQIRAKLISARQSLATMQAPHVIANSLGVLIAFRLILLISNLICIHRLVEYFEPEAVRHMRS